MFARVRHVIRQADPEIVEEWKWRGVLVWSRAGIVCTGETYNAIAKLTFAKGAALDNPSRLFNSSLDGNIRRHRHPRWARRSTRRCWPRLFAPLSP